MNHKVKHNVTSWA